MGSVKERLKEYLAYKGVSARKFTLSIGVSEAYVQTIGKSIPPDKLERISKAYPDLNLLWLVLGIGEMLNEQGVSNYRRRGMGSHQADGIQLGIQRPASGNSYRPLKKGRCPDGRSCRMCRCRVVDAFGSTLIIPKY